MFVRVCGLCGCVCVFCKKCISPYVCTFAQNLLCNHPPPLIVQNKRVEIKAQIKDHNFVWLYNTLGGCDQASYQIIDMKRSKISMIFQNVFFNILGRIVLYRMVLPKSSQTFAVYTRSELIWVHKS